MSCPQPNRHVVLLAYLLSAAPLFAQDQASAPSPAETAICNRYGQQDRCESLTLEFHTRKLLTVRGAAPQLEPTGNDTAFSAALRPYATKAILEQVKQKLLQTISTSAAVTQVGSASFSGGSTNLTAKPTTTDFLSVAAESGAFTDTLNGSALAIQGNANGLLKYLTNKPVFAVNGHSWSDALQALTFSVALNVAQSSGSTTASTGSANSSPLNVGSILLPSNNASFSSFQTSYMVYRPYNPASKDAQKTVTDALTKNDKEIQSAGSAIAAAMNKLAAPIATSKGIASARTTWIAEGKQAEASQSFDALVKAYAKYVKAYLDALAQVSGFDQDALALQTAVQAYSSTVYDVMNDVRGKPYLTFTYTYATPVQKPATHDGTLILSYLFKGGKDDDGVRTFMTGAQLTGNFTGSVFASVPSGATYGRLRAVQLSAEFDKPIGGTTAAPRATASLAGYGQYQYSATVLNVGQSNLAPGTNIMLPPNSQVLVGTPGWIGVVQGKVAINLKQGLSLPLAIKWSNRTDLLQANDVRGQFGLSYDLSALSQLITSH